MKRLFNLPLSARLLIIFIITALLAVIILASFFSRGLGSQWQRAIAPHLSQYVQYIRDDIGVPPNETRARKLAAALPIEIQVHRNDTLLFSTRTHPVQVDQLRFFIPRRFRQEHRQRAQRLDLPDYKFAYNEQSNRPIMRVHEGEYTFYVEMGQPQNRDRRHDDLFYAIGALTILLAICYWLIRRLLAPIGRLQNTVQAISDGDLNVRTSETGSDDLSRLANSVDTMAERIQKMLDSKRELLLAISHELRTPLTRARVAAELVEISPFQKKIITNIDDMEALIGQLVESERLQQHSILNLNTVELNLMISTIVDSLPEDIYWQPLPSAVLLNADEARLNLMVRSLLANAVTHGKKHAQPAQVSIHLAAESDSINIIVSDKGPGIVEEHLKSISDAFYRPDFSRSRKTGGFGLGLYLCRRIAEAHGGKLLIDSSTIGDTGTHVTVTLPFNSDGND